MRTRDVTALNRIDPGLVMILSSVESMTGNDFYLTSIDRSEEENEAVGGWSKSQHVDWDRDGDAQAVDIRRSSFTGSPESIARLFFGQGATGVGIYDTHIHVDNNPSRVNNPYFKDYRKKKTKYDERINIKGFEYFRGFYNKTLANLRKGSTQDRSGQTPGGKFSSETLIAVGAAVVSIFVLLGLIDE